MNKKELEVVLSDALLVYGFKGKKSAWYRDVQETLQVVDLQKSSYGEQFFINLCCVPRGMVVDGMPAPKENKCPIRIRLASAIPSIRTEVERLFDLSTDIDDAKRTEMIKSILDDELIPFMEHMRDDEALVSSIKNGVFKGGAVSSAARKHLGLGEW